jgi:hypothetical protein
MKRLLIPLFVLSAIWPGTAFAQSSQQPFIFTLYGGLFFPANLNFAERYHSNSDITWGVGIALPATNLLYITGDEGFFKTDAFADKIPDSTASLEEHFTHAGVLLKHPLTQLISFRLAGGLNYVSVKQTIAGPVTPAHTVEAEKKIGYYGSAGIEELVPELHIAVFCDVVYDYRRSHQLELVGDFGGIRALLGVHLILF